MRCLDRHRYFLRPRARDREDPLRHGGQAGAVVREAARSQPDTSRVAHMDLMILRAPIDTRKPALLMFHAQLLSCHGAMSWAIRNALPVPVPGARRRNSRSEEHPSELQSLMRI